jgi:integrase
MASFRKRGDKWTFQIETKDDNGQRKQISKGGFRTKKEATAAAAELQLKLDRGEYHENKQITVGAFFAEWLNNYARQNLKPGTYKNRRHMINARILPALGKMQLDKLKPLHFIKLYNELFDNGLSSNYINTIHRLCLNALKFAVLWQYLNVSPMTGVTAPKIEKKTVKTWTIEEVKMFLESLTTERYKTAFYIAIYTGMRRGEILALKWSDVDLKNGVLSVTGGKTKSAARQISLSAALVLELKKQKATQNEIKLYLGGAYNDLDLVCCTETGTACLPRNLNRAFYAALKKCSSVPVIRFHDLRHTHATMLLSLGENPKIVSERLGHSRVNITLDTYSHVLPDMQRVTADKLNAALK